MIYRITWGGIYDCEADNEEDAKQQFINYVEQELTDDYGRDWKDLIDCEELEDKE
jgi:hypothetical protein